MSRISRRGFIVRGSIVAGGSGMLAVPAPVLRAAQVAAAGLSAGAPATLEQIVYDIFPHSGLRRSVYTHVVDTLLAQAADDTALRALLEQGIAQLDAAAGATPWRDLARQQRLKILDAISKDAFFQRVRVAATSIYGDPEVWQRIGYPGSSIEHGGYLNRGFGDIDWLP
ncbi:MAG: gluconate 2-dehydrogenase subunit 3 family protein [Gammaproteobacteria bacterium]|nr:gluconate 2-dehydrogenase subunit 3 family protein [Gammaproteobacteria bacterium]